MTTPEPATVTSEQTATSNGPAAVPEGAAEQDHCPACGAPLSEGQEWCLECGAARTVIEAPPDWRVGVAIMLAVIALAAIVVIIVWP